MTEALRTNGEWGKFEMIWQLGLYLPTTYIGRKTPTFDTYVRKDAKYFLISNSISPPTCTDC